MDLNMFATSPKGGVEEEAENAMDMQHYSTMDFMDMLESDSFEIAIPKREDPNKDGEGEGDMDEQKEEEKEIEREEREREEAEVNRETTYPDSSLRDLNSFCSSDVIPKNEVEIGEYKMSYLTEATSLGIGGMFGH